MDDSNTKAIVRANGEGEYLSFYGGGLMNLKVTNAESNGAFLLFEDVMSKGKTTPMHIHDNNDETFYVLEGDLIVNIDGKNQNIGQHGVVMVPRGIAHAFMVVSEKARVLTLLTPGSAEDFYRMASVPAEASTDPEGNVDMDKIMEAAKKTGAMRIVGPPPFSN